MRVRPRARRSTRVLLVLYVYYMNHNEYTQQAQQGHPRRARHPLALEGHRNPDRSPTLLPGWSYVPRDGWLIWPLSGKIPRVLL